MSSAENDFGAGSMEEILAQMDGDLQGKKFKSPYYAPPADFEGTIKIRILPLLKSFKEKIFYSTYKEHWVNKKPYLCLNQTLIDKDGNLHEPEDCPICKKTKELYNIAGDDKEAEERMIASQISARTNYIVRAVVRGRKDDQGNDLETTPVFWKFGKTIFEALKGWIASQEYGNFLSTIEGRDLNLVKSGKGRNAKYAGSYLAVSTTPVFSEKEKLTKLLSELQKMEYKQLFTFSSFSEMTSGLEEANLSAAPKPQAAVQEKTEEKVVIGAKPDKDVLKSHTAEPFDAPGDDSDSIDDLLNSF
jgi:hypothetical protein